MIDKGFKQIIARTTIFLALFIGVSFLIGQKILESSLLYGFNIFIYGGMGYILLFSLVGFIILYRQRLIKLGVIGYRVRDGIILMFGIILVIIFYVLELNISGFQVNFLNTLLVHSLFLSMLFLLFLGAFGLDLIRLILKRFKRELLYFLVFGVIAYSLMNWAWKLWPYLSFIVLKIVYFALNLISSDVSVSGEVIGLNNFSAQIGEACSGIYSIFLFSALYIFIVLLDWNKIDKSRAIFLFIPAVLGAFLVNVIRVFLIMIAGAYVSREAALGLYHSYVGMVLFLIYFTFFWLFFYKWIKRDKGQGKINFIYNKLKADSLYQNSVFLMLSTLVMSFFGFIFWIVCARLFSANEVGLATTIISIMSLVVSFSVLGLNIGLIRYLPGSKRKNEKINSVFTLVALITIIVSTIFLLLVNDFSPKLYFIKENLLLSVVFIVFMIFASLSSLIESVFIAFRSTKFILIKNTIFSSLKIAFPFFLVGLGAYGIFTSWMLAVIVSFTVSLLILVYRFGFKPKIVFYDRVIRKVGRYSFGNYVAGLVGGLPAMFLPLIITNYLSAETTAYYYISMMIATLLFTVSQATSNSLFAEGSSGKDLKVQVKKSFKIILPLLILGIVLILLFGNYLLLVFGNDYSSEGFSFLRILAFSGIFVSVNSVFNAILKVKNMVREMITRSVIGSFLIILLSFVFIYYGFGLLGIGYAWIIGQALISVTYLVLWKR